MRVNRVCLVILVVLLLGMAAAPISAPAGAAQAEPPWCEADYATATEPLDSQALGLTHEELDDLYAPGEALQTGWLYERDGFSLLLSECNLDVNIDPDGPYANQDASRELARSLLPQDAVPMGSWRFGSFMTTYMEIEEWLSPDLALRYRELGEIRTGSILVVYTYTHMGAEDDRVTLIQLGSGTIPR